MFLTGQMPFPGTSVGPIVSRGHRGADAPGDAATSSHRAAEASALGLADVVAARVFLARFEQDYAAHERRVTRATSRPGGRPARTCVGVTALAKGALVEIDARRAPAGVSNGR